MSEQDSKQSQYYQEDFLASHSVQPGSDEARKMTVTSGRKCLELYRRLDPVGSLVRMLLASSHWRSTKCFLTWKESATPAKRLLFRLVPSMPRTGETVVPFWATPTERDSKGANSMEHLTREGRRNHTDQLANQVRFWPMPSAMDAKGLDRNLWKDATATRSVLLCQKIAMFPTPLARDFKSPDMDPNSKRFSQKTELPSVVGGQLNPAWVEQMMGFPIGWTKLED